MGNMKPFVDCSSVVKAMNKIKNAYETSPVVFERTLKDMRSRAPGKVASAVTSVYGIKKSEIKCKSNSFKRGAGKIYARGNDLASFELLYYGRVLTPLHFGMTPKQAPSSENSKGRKKYKVKAKIKKSEKKKGFITPEDEEEKGMGVFLAPSQKTTTQIPWIRFSKDPTDIWPVKTLSLPQMIGPTTDNEGNEWKGNPDVKKMIDKDLGELCKKRFDNALKQHLNRKLK